MLYIHKIIGWGTLKRKTCIYRYLSSLLCIVKHLSLLIKIISILFYRILSLIFDENNPLFFTFTIKKNLTCKV